MKKVWLRFRFSIKSQGCYYLSSSSAPILTKTTRVDRQRIAIFYYIAEIILLVYISGPVFISGSVILVTVP